MASGAIPGELLPRVNHVMRMDRDLHFANVGPCHERIRILPVGLFLQM